MSNALATNDVEPAEVPVRIVDCDIHVNPRNGMEIPNSLPEPWLSKGFRELLFAGATIGTSVIFASPNEGRRLDAFTPLGPPGSDPNTTGRQLFDEAGVDLAIIIPMMERNSANWEHEAAWAAAMNTWLSSSWLGAYNGHGRYKGTLRISTDPELAVAEIERWAGHPHFVQIMLNPFHGGLFGEQRFWPVYEAAIRHKLAVCTHVTLQRPGPALQTTYGPPTYYIENHGQFPLVYMAHLTSMLCEGVFEKFPDLRFTFVEGGFSWALPFIWRMDRHWKELRREAPMLKRPPSEYLRTNVSFTRQPVEEPKNPLHLARVIEMLGPHCLEFATDYPHWDGDYNPKQYFTGVSPELKQRILGLNAIEKYRLSATRSGRHWREFGMDAAA
jgi:predicted TIM-barrel fold metal-dependent hydrolase